MTVRKDELEELRAAVAFLEAELAHAHKVAGLTSPLNPPPPSYKPAVQELIPVYAPEASNETTGAEDGTNRDVDAVDAVYGAILSDSTGNSVYHGRTSGATFLNILREFIITSELLIGKVDPAVSFLDARGRYQTWDFRPMKFPTLLTADAKALPAEAEMYQLVNTFHIFMFDNKSSSGGIFFWPLHPNPLALTSAETAPRNARGRQPVQDLALHHAVFAYATMLNLTEANSYVEGKLGEEHCARACKLLPDPRDVWSTQGHPTSTDVAALTLVALYLIENNRRDKAYNYIGIATRISTMRGIHVGDSNGGVLGRLTPIEAEIERRTFWNLCVVDRYVLCYHP